MNQDISTEMLAALTTERNALRDFVSFLEREQSALVENLTDQLLAIAEQKSARALALTGLAEARHVQFKNALPELGAETIQTWLKTHNQQGWQLWIEIRALAERARQLNQSSGELIQMKLRHNQQALAVLGNAANQANLYGPDGHPSFAPGSGRPLASV